MGNEKLKISICITVLNEGRTISQLLQSLLIQTKKADEIVICDGGSKDQTIQIIKLFQKKFENILFFVSPGSVAHGRNVSIEHAQGEIIATIDAGCIAKKDWLEKLSQAFKNSDVDIVAGFYEMKYKNSFQKVMALYRGTDLKRFNKNNFMPSCRSVAFKKSVWKELGGFNEKLSLSGEDTQFFYRAIQTDTKIVRVKSALVEWKEPEQFSFKDFKKFFYYAKGDAQAGIWWHPVQKWRTHSLKIISIFIRYIFLFTLFGLGFKYNVFLVYFFVFFLLYVFWSVWKLRDIVGKWSEIKWIPVVQIGTDVMIMAGFMYGILTKLQE